MSYPGYLVSNELDRFGIRLPRGQAEVHLGVGSTTNWDIASIRLPKILIVLDSSLDVLLGHYAFYRPLFFISDTRERFLANFSGFSTSGDNLSLARIFDRILADEPPQVQALSHMRDQLHELGQKNVDESSANFALEVVRTRPGEKSSHPFKFIAGRESLLNQFAKAYDTRKVSRLIWMPRFFHRSFSFLSTPSRYAAVRDLYMRNNVFLLNGSIPDEWISAALKEICLQRSLRLTDVYLSNVPSLLSSDSVQSEEAIERWLGLFQNCVAPTLFAYEVKMLKFPHRFVTWQLSKASN